MGREREFAGIDWFRIAAALLIVAIHTSPLDSISLDADFFLTRVLARVAVPFFFMVTGFFVLSNRKRSRKFLKKTAVLYIGVTILYLPIQIYAGNFAKEPFLFTLVKDLLFNGTFYHLWYLPAALLGVLIFGSLVRKFGAEGMLPAAFLLYAVGLLGDSYFGFGQSIPFFQVLYKGIFYFSDYTRNGLFFAPVFLVMGAILASPGRKKPSLKANTAGLIISFALMTAEAFWLRAWGWPRHDSMYVMLVPCMYFLFQLLTIPKGKTPKGLRSCSMLIYLLHPMTILVARALAKGLNAQAVLLDNGLIYYALVVFITFTISLGLEWLVRSWKNKTNTGELANENTERVWAEISRSHLVNNIKECRRRLCSECQIMAVVKADAYGHGSIYVSQYLEKMGVTAFAVATLEEGILLRKHRIRNEILIMGYTPPERVLEIRKFHLTQTAIDYRHAQELNTAGYPIRVHIKIDSGMHRLGEDWRNEDKICKLFAMENLKVEGIYTHLGWADGTGKKAQEFTRNQINRFYGLLDRLMQNGIELPRVHIQSSFGMLNLPQLQCDYARIGVALYGALPPEYMDGFRPVLSWKSRVILVRELDMGESAGYECGFTAPRQMRIGIVSAGYADGVPRSLSCGKGAVLICGKKVPILGLICMDRLMIDLTAVVSAEVGSVVTLIGKDGNLEITAAELAENAGTIANELLSRIGGRVKRMNIL